MKRSGAKPMSKPSNSSSGMVPLLKLRENSATLASPKMVTFHLKRPQASLLLKEVYIDGELKPLDTTQWYLAPGDAGNRLVADLPLPRLAAAAAVAPDRYRTVQVRRVQAERVDHGDAEP